MKKSILKICALVAILFTINVSAQDTAGAEGIDCDQIAKELSQQFKEDKKGVKEAYKETKKEINEAFSEAMKNATSEEEREDAHAAKEEALAVAKETYDGEVEAILIAVQEEADALKEECGEITLTGNTGDSKDTGDSGDSDDSGDSKDSKDKGDKGNSKDKGSKGKKGKGKG